MGGGQSSTSSNSGGSSAGADAGRRGRIVRRYFLIFATLVTGIVMSCYYVGYVMGTVIAPPLLRQLGHIRVFAALAAVASVAILIQGGFVNPWTWGAMRLVSGLCFAGIYVVAESWLNDRATRANRGRLFALYMLILYVGLGAAQFLLILSDPRTPAPFMLVSVLISGTQRGFFSTRSQRTTISSLGL